jgi:hypothetical protein
MNADDFANNPFSFRLHIPGGFWRESYKMGYIFREFCAIQKTCQHLCSPLPLCVRALPPLPPAVLRCPNLSSGLPASALCRASGALEPAVPLCASDEKSRPRPRQRRLCLVPLRAAFVLCFVFVPPASGPLPCFRCLGARCAFACCLCVVSGS